VIIELTMATIRESLTRKRSAESRIPIRERISNV
jgi:hypothetical protein